MIIAMTTVIPVATPAAGQGWTYTSTGILLQALRFRLATSAVVANRTWVVQFDSGAGTTPYLGVIIPAQQAASLTIPYSLYPGAVSATGFLTAGTAPIPPNLNLPAGHRIQCVPLGFDAADQIDQIAIVAA